MGDLPRHIVKVTGAGEGAGWSAGCYGADPLVATHVYAVTVPDEWRGHASLDPAPNIRTVTVIAVVTTATRVTSPLNRGNIKPL